MNTLIEMATSFYGRPTPGAPDAAQEHAHAAASHEYAPARTANRVPRDHGGEAGTRATTQDIQFILH
jgi:hypothetical protein